MHLIFDKQSGGDCVLFSRRLHRILLVNLLIGLSCQLADRAKQFCLVFDATRTYQKKVKGAVPLTVFIGLVLAMRLVLNAEMSMFIKQQQQQQQHLLGINS